MPKQKKKRTKTYHGEDARTLSQGPTLHRYTAPMRGPLAEWLHDRKETLRVIAIAVGGFLLIGVIVVEVFRLLFLHSL